MVMPCHTCAGSGEITEERARWIEEGFRLFRWRVDHEPAYLSAGRAATLCGVTAREWIDAEVGRVDPAPLIARVLA